MKVYNYNADNLADTEIDEIVTRVKMFIFNDNDEILLAFSNGGCQLPGGHIEEGEDLLLGLIREVKEETGITLEPHEISAPFFEINKYTKNYKDSGKNRISKMIYYTAHTDKLPDLSQIKLTDREKEYNFHVSFISRQNFIPQLEHIIATTTEHINISIATEIIQAYNELK